MTVGELKKLLEKYPDNMEVKIEGALMEGFDIEGISSNWTTVLLCSPYIVNTLEDALGEDL